MCFNREGAISTSSSGPLKIVDKFRYLDISISSTECGVNIRLAKGLTDLSAKIKQDFLQAAIVSVLLYGCTTWTMIKRMEKKVDWNCTRML